MQNFTLQNAERPKSLALDGACKTLALDGACKMLALDGAYKMLKRFYLHLFPHCQIYMREK